MDKLDEWNEIKKEIVSKNTFFTFKVREIYWLKIGQNVGYETHGKGEEFLRPVLIFRKFDLIVKMGV